MLAMLFIGYVWLAVCDYLQRDDIQKLRERITSLEAWTDARDEELEK